MKNNNETKLLVKGRKRTKGLQKTKYIYFFITIVHLFFYVGLLHKLEKFPEEKLFYHKERKINKANKLARDTLVLDFLTLLA